MHDFERFLETVAGIAVSQQRRVRLDELGKKYRELYGEWRLFNSLCEDEKSESNLYEAYYPLLAKIAGQIQEGKTVFRRGVERVNFLVYGKC
jgi:hypothetical protein